MHSHMVEGPWAGHKPDANKAHSVANLSLAAPGNVTSCPALQAGYACTAMVAVATPPGSQVATRAVACPLH